VLKQIVLIFSGTETFQLIPIFAGFSSQTAACLLMISYVTFSGLLETSINNSNWKIHLEFIRGFETS